MDRLPLSDGEGSIPARAEGTATDERATTFRRLSREHLDASYRLARAIMGSSVAAEDAVHDAFVTAWRKWHTLRDQDRFEAWFRRILVNTCRNQLKRSSRIRIADLSTAPHPAIDDPQIATSPEREAIGRAMRELGEDQRVVLALRYYRDLTIDQIAELLEIRPGTVKSRLHHAQRLLRAALESQQRTETA